MRVTFNAAIDEIVDAQIRIFSDSAVGRRDRHVAALATSVVAGAVVALITWGFGPAIAISFTAAGAALGYFLFGREYRKTLTKKVRKLVVEQLGQDTPVAVSVSLEDGGLLVEQLRTTVEFRWEQITGMVDLPAAVEFRAVRPVGLMRIPARAFPSMTDRAAFVRLAHQHLEAVRESVEPEPAVAR
jgi:hypothetical protein